MLCVCVCARVRACNPSELHTHSLSYAHLALSFLSRRYIQSTCATSGEGLYEGLDWLSGNIAKATP